MSLYSARLSLYYAWFYKMSYVSELFKLNSSG